MSFTKLSRRAANYSRAELDCLVRYLEEHPDLVHLKLGGQYATPEDVKLAWEELAERICEVGGCFGTRRTGQEVKKKWSDFKSRVKAKAVSLAMDNDNGGSPKVKFTPIEERVLALISPDYELQPSQRIEIPSTSKFASVKVFSFHNDSNSGDIEEYDLVDEGDKTTSSNPNESEILEEIKISCSEDKKRRISEAFSTPNVDKKSLNLKRLKVVSEEEQLQELCLSQQELNSEIRNLKDILKKCQMSIEKIALLKRAELRLKCAKYGVEFEDLFD